MINLHTAPIVVVTAAVVHGIWRKYGATASNFQVDRLSEVPNGVLLHILSYVSLRDVGRMSVLSRQWRKICLDVPSLDFDWQVFYTPPRNWTEWVDWVLSSSNFRKHVCWRRMDTALHKYRGQNMITSFSLKCGSKRVLYVMNKLINFAAASKGTLQSLTLQFPNYKRSAITDSFLSQFCYLRNLHLSSCILDLKLEINSLRLSSYLTTLDLYDVCLKRTDNITQWQDILSNCAATVECLRLISCCLPDKLCFGTNFLRLSFLEIKLDSRSLELELSAPKLKRFDFYGYNQALNCTYEGVSNLESVHIFLQCVTEDSLESLAVGASPKSLSFQGFYPVMNKLPTNPHKLFHSVLKLSISWMVDDGSIAPSLPRLIASFPLLEKLEIEFPKEFDCQVELPSLHVHNNLKEIKLLGFDLVWIPVAIYLLQSALVLDLMVITKSYKGGMSPWEDMKIISFIHNERQIILNSLSGKASSTNVRFILTWNIP